MSRWYFSKKTEADYLLKVRTWFLKQHGYFTWFNQGTITWTNGISGNKSCITIQSTIRPENPHVRLIYTQTDRDTGDKKDFDYSVSLVSTKCHFGGERWWFICPLTIRGVPCGRRVGALYKDGDYFGCRHCYKLTYESRNENRRYKMYPLFATLTADQKADELEQSMKRRIYAGKPTRKQRRLEQIYRRSFPYMREAMKLA